MRNVLLTITLLFINKRLPVVFKKSRLQYVCTFFHSLHTICTVLVVGLIEHGIGLVLGGAGFLPGEGKGDFKKRAIFPRCAQFRFSRCAQYEKLAMLAAPSDRY